MKLLNVKIVNYKGFQETDDIILDGNMNVVVGRNHSGKTAFLEALALRSLQNKPHISSDLLQGDAIDQHSYVIAECVLDHDDIIHSIAAMPNGQVALPIPTSLQQNEEGAKGLVAALSSTGAYARARYRGGNGIDFEEFPMVRPKGTMNGSRNRPNLAVFFISYDNKIRKIFADARVPPSSGTDGSAILVDNIVSRKLYLFKAERIGLGDGAIGPSDQLNSNASNLPEVLINLASRNEKYREYTELVREVLPEIREISVKPINATKAEIRVSTADPRRAHERHMLPLSEGGTGVGQVLAILYVVFTSPDGRVILIDEPNSFLHPGAARRLISILRSYSPHQYVIATHSPETISACKPDAVFMIKWVAGHSDVERLGAGEISSTRRILDEIGAKLSDVFGADRVVWVEGPTEMACFPLLLEAEGLGTKDTISFVPVSSTASFGKKSKQLALDVHSRLATGNALIPPTLAFIFDREEITEADRKELQRNSGGLLYFHPRRSYENFLLHSHAISALLNSPENMGGQIIETVSPKSIESWFAINGTKRDLFPRWSGIPAVNSPEWLVVVDAPELLKRLFNAVRETPEEYRKTSHSRWLTEWLLANDRDYLRPLAEFIRSVADRRAD